CLRVIVDNFEELSDSQLSQVLEELRDNTSKYLDHHQFVIAGEHVAIGINELPITNHLQAQIANPARSALEMMAAARIFKPRWRYGYLPLEATLFTGRQIKANWERVALQTGACVDLWLWTLELLKNERRLPLFLVISG